MKNEIIIVFDGTSYYIQDPFDMKPGEEECGRFDDWEEASEEVDRLNDLAMDKPRRSYVRQPYFGPNGPTGHGDICISDADCGL